MESSWCTTGGSQFSKIAIAMKKSNKPKLFDIIISGFSGAIGFEIFVLLNYAYFHLAGPDIVIALALGGVINLLIMLSYCELGAAMPLVGGEYRYIRAAYGGYLGFVFGFFRWLAAIFAAALATVAFVLQLAFLFSAISPNIQTMILKQSWILCIVIVAVLGALEVRGSRTFGSLVVVAFILLFAGFTVGGFVHGIGHVAFFSKPLSKGAAGVFASMVYMFPMFIGAKSLISGAASARPEKDIPRALIITSILLIPFYVLLALVAVVTVNPAELIQQVSLLNFAASSLFGDFGKIVFSIAGMIACLSSVGTALAVQSSVARGMSKDGYFPKILQSVSARFGTFHIAAIVGSIFIMAFSVLGAVPFLGYAGSFGSLFVFAGVNLSVMKLRKVRPHMNRPFKTPFYPITPILGIALTLGMIVGPVLLGDGNATDALTSAVGLTALAFSTYYLRMVGHIRVQIALGGIGSVIGVSMVAVSIAALLNLVTPPFHFIPSIVLLLFGLVLIVVGYFNFITGDKLPKGSQ